ncbi:toprim domain-containing protein [Rhodopirellula sallentina]|uniref:DNA topoisomerase (ATP-hydrolyzing) n=1 Tax=Rhodopirellula sallentina SM41 TaxID=1263870 RepID=M5UBZ5_9BACT|nr:toprim domain-containing protein [Rhodopirellula sallentina]EMI55376.1 DNA gyrase subunit B [Rhodopirellula sallentina SM41]
MIAYGKQPTHYPCEAVGSVGAVDPQKRVGVVTGTECLIVEGDSAAKSVDQVRDARVQSILALQGKPLNAIKAGRDAARSNEVFCRIFETLLGSRMQNPADCDEAIRNLASPQNCVYEKLVLLMDPDADGIHCSVLMMAFFRKYAPDLIRAGRIEVVRPPMFVFRLQAVSSNDVSRWPVASSPEHAAAVEDALKKHGVTDYQRIRHRGLGSLHVPLLRSTCVDPASRRQSCLTIEEVDSAISMFGS